ncbi:hypothetical protein L6164_031565 [Bauhinia variegata]|uniref:Uncharacterized protein n=1 Tax=Bauhinia variegata TaxID=167791 RepID=A0ACB9LFT9_BAUVA|nr:hypothetical protein L6164_031565 [Bauhinia variegata]
MGRQDNNPTVTNSSIALLQERFRQLEKVKERREGKELLKLFSETQKGSSSIHLQPSGSSLQPRLVAPHRPSNHHDYSLSLGLDLANMVTDNHNTRKTTPSASSWPDGAATSRNFDNSDVDTSLHL